MKNSQYWMGELYDRFDVDSKPIRMFNKSKEHLIIDLGRNLAKKYLHMNTINIYSPEDEKGRRILIKTMEW